MSNPLPGIIAGVFAGVMTSALAFVMMPAGPEVTTSDSGDADLDMKVEKLSKELSTLRQRNNDLDNRLQLVQNDYTNLQTWTKTAAMQVDSRAEAIEERGADNEDIPIALSKVASVSPGPDLIRQELVLLLRENPEFLEGAIRESNRKRRDASAKRHRESYNTFLKSTYTRLLSEAAKRLKTNATQQAGLSDAFDFRREQILQLRWGNETHPSRNNDSNRSEEEQKKIDETFSSMIRKVLNPDQAAVFFDPSERLNPAGFLGFRPPQRTSGRSVAPPPRKSRPDGR